MRCYNIGAANSGLWSTAGTVRKSVAAFRPAKQQGARRFSRGLWLELYDILQAGVGERR